MSADSALFVRLLWNQFFLLVTSSFYIPTQYVLKNWTDAEVYCNTECNSNLLSIHSAEQYETIVAYVEDKREISIWLGLNDIASNSDYVWTDGSAFTFGNVTDTYPWVEGHVAHGAANKNCVYMSRFDAYKWNDVSCLLDTRFACNECNGVTIPPLTTASPTTTGSPTTTTMQPITSTPTTTTAPPTATIQPTTPTYTTPTTPTVTTPTVTTPITSTASPTMTAAPTTTTEYSTTSDDELTTTATTTTTSITTVQSTNETETETGTTSLQTTTTSATESITTTVMNSTMADTSFSNFSIIIKIEFILNETAAASIHNTSFNSSVLLLEHIFMNVSQTITDYYCDRVDLSLIATTDHPNITITTIATTPLYDCDDDLGIEESVYELADVLKAELYERYPIHMQTVTFLNITIIVIDRVPVPSTTVGDDDDGDDDAQHHDLVDHGKLWIFILVIVLLCCFLSVMIASLWCVRTQRFKLRGRAGSASSAVTTPMSQWRYPRHGTRTETDYNDDDDDEEEEEEEEDDVELQQGHDESLPMMSKHSTYIHKQTSASAHAHVHGFTDSGGFGVIRPQVVVPLHAPLPPPKQPSSSALAMDPHHFLSSDDSSVEEMYDNVATPNLIEMNSRLTNQTSADTAVQKVTSKSIAEQKADELNTPQHTGAQPNETGREGVDHPHHDHDMQAAGEPAGTVVYSEGGDLGSIVLGLEADFAHDIVHMGSILREESDDLEHTSQQRRLDL